MTAHDLLSQLREKGVEVKTSGDDRLVIDAPKGTITEDLRSALAAHKAELLQILKGEQAGNESVAPVSEAPQPVSPKPKARLRLCHPLLSLRPELAKRRWHGLCNSR